jgi:thiol-disulfide isomerase/thioredoxin
VTRLIAPLVLVAAVAVALVLTAGGGTNGDAATPGPAVPALSIARLDGDGQFALATLTTAGRPTLLWFWAPWCEVCSHEAPAVEQLASDAKDELSVVAIGGRDQAANGPAFVERHRPHSPCSLPPRAL